MVGMPLRTCQCASLGCWRSVSNDQAELIEQKVDSTLPRGNIHRNMRVRDRYINCVTRTRSVQPRRSFRDAFKESRSLSRYARRRLLLRTKVNIKSKRSRWGQERREEADETNWHAPAHQECRLTIRANLARPSCERSLTRGRNLEVNEDYSLPKKYSRQRTAVAKVGFIPNSIPVLKLNGFQVGLTCRESIHTCSK